MTTSAVARGDACCPFAGGASRHQKGLASNDQERTLPFASSASVIPLSSPASVLAMPVKSLFLRLRDDERARIIDAIRRNAAFQIDGLALCSRAVKRFLYSSPLFLFNRPVAAGQGLGGIAVATHKFHCAMH